MAWVEKMTPIVLEGYFRKLEELEWFKRKENDMEKFKVGEYIVYVNGDIYELGRIKSIIDDGAFVAYHEGEAGAYTSFDLMHKLINGYCVKKTTLGGEFFKGE